jgi:hypothetical protein
MFLRATHLTRYTYSQPVAFAPHAIYLRPRETPRQRLHSFAITLSPTAKLISTGDANENALDWAYYPPATRADTLEIRTEFMVETLDTNPFDFFLAPSANAFPFTYSPAAPHPHKPHRADRDIALQDVRNRRERERVSTKQRRIEFARRVVDDRLNHRLIFDTLIRVVG